MRVVLRIVAILGCLLGVVFLAVGVFLGVSSISFRSSAVHATGTVVEVRESLSCSDRPSRRGTGGGNSGCQRVYTPVVRFTTATGRQITFTPDYANSSRPTVGASIGVLYHPDDPRHARVDSFSDLWLLPIIFTGIGLLFGALGAVFASRLVVGARRRAWLKESGMRIPARIQDVRRIQNVRINGRNPWRIFAGWQDPTTGRQYTFRSDLLTQNPAEALQGTGTIDVLIDPADPGRRYWMDLGSRAIDG
ncbi:DUF3592 domain-containing protein [Microlunatus elymi]|uniref:DUF3592 domain-containing protein n=1 Tax=Microlunatus elymi TaxID=2596828 RepID=A0A516Q0N7_9ACTN|nr:DUF3592 domain-containing protein [Microlunatus elymi]QDP97003.1 DUF3592 domain-containing protein [Microlunatus elymi]